MMPFALLASPLFNNCFTAARHQKKVSDPVPMFQYFLIDSIKSYNLNKFFCRFWIVVWKLFDNILFSFQIMAWDSKFSLDLLLNSVQSP